MSNVANSDLRAPMRERRYQRWVAIALGCVLLLFAQAMASAKTLLEQYLNCDGIEEVAFSVDYSPKTYYYGTCQGNNFLLLVAQEPIDSIPKKLEKEPSLNIACRFEKTWWVINTSEYFYDRKIWEEKGIPEEDGNEVEEACLSWFGLLCAYAQNFGLGHSGMNMTLDRGNYKDRKGDISVDYVIQEKNDAGFPTIITAHVADEKDRFLPLEWRNQIDYRTNESGVTVPHIISRYGKGGLLSKDGTEVLMDRIVITKLVLAQKKLPREHFLRPEFENTDAFPPAGPWTYYLQTNQFVGFDETSNLVVRMEPDDPRLLQPYDKKKLIGGYWIVATLISGVAIVFLLIMRNKEKIK